MTEIIAEPDEGGRALIYVTLNYTSPVTEIIRVDSNGTAPLRTRRGALPTTGTGTLVLYDWEAAISGPVEYRVGNIVARTSLNQDLPVFGIPTRATHLRVRTVTEYTYTRPTRSSFHEIIGRPDPIGVLRRMGPRSGRLDVVFTDYGQAMSLEALAATGDVLMYRQAEHPGADLYFIVTDLTVTAGVDGAWIVQMTYRGTRRPLGALDLPSGWDFIRLAEIGGSFTEVAQDYGTFIDLTGGETT